MKAMTKEQVADLIRKAFDGVLLGDGIGLWEAQAIDDYAGLDLQSKARLEDEKIDWSRISRDTLFRCDSSLSFFDADGMRFHLPAFMLAELDGDTNGGVVFHLSHLNDYVLSMFTSLNVAQIGAVIEFLNWCVSQSAYEFESPQIIRALNEHWLKI